MTLYLNLRESQPQMMSGDGGPGARLIADEAVNGEIRGRTVVFGVHGFNVRYKSGLRSLARLDAALKLPQSHVFIGVLWPGDFWVPVINYPAEWEDAVKGGQALARYAQARMASAPRFAFVSHSLGGRLALEAAAHLPDDRVGRVCLMAAATDDNCLERPYDVSLRKAQKLTGLASRKDKVLAVAYPLGDFAGDLLFRDKDSPFRGALGRYGPRFKTPNWVRIENREGFTHSDYFPPGDTTPLKPTQGKAIRYARDFLLSDEPGWA
ncbi:alpha/beta fold hydrolase [Caulobacter segnis]|uniref:alpha/beta hydrolase n=1 Tax=Caulobacter segnis TaxID=88688 RepID=UPI002410278E|nr:alpha/beta hydrolase [Caulobacter segnis]MDG2520002.1 alpha/beta fold hydrolase [Caulobacter segnis]